MTTRPLQDDPRRMDETPPAKATEIQTTLVHHEGPIRIHVGDDAGDGRFFRLFNALVDSGTWAALPDGARNLLVVYSRFANRHGLAWPAVSTLERATGMSRTAVYRNRAILAATPMPGAACCLLALEGEGSRRKTPTFRVAAVPLAGEGGPASGTPNKPESHQRDRSVPLAGLNASTSPAGGTPSRPGITQTNEQTTAGAPRPAVRVRRADPTPESAAAALRSAGGFGDREARHLVDLGGPRRAMDMIANLEVLQRNKAAGTQPALRTSPRRYLRWAMRQDAIGVFDEVEKARMRDLEAELTARLEQACSPRLDQAGSDLLNRAFGGPAAVIRSRVLPMELLEDPDDDALFAALMSCAREALATGARA